MSAGYSIHCMIVHVSSCDLGGRTGITTWDWVKRLKLLIYSNKAVHICSHLRQEHNML